MTRFCHLLLLGSLILLALAGRARAGLSTQVGTHEGMGVRIDVTGPISEVPPSGCFFCWVTIHNHSGAPRTWDLRCEASSRTDRGDNLAVSQSLRVENESSARVPLLLPLPPATSKSYFYQSVSLSVDGYGIETRQTNLASTTTASSPPKAFLGLGDALATPIWSSLDKNYRDKSQSLVGAPVDVAQFGPDWRALAGFDCLWLTDGEYTALDAGQRVAIRRWIDQGGIFYLSARTLDPAWRAGLGLPETGDEGEPGFGRVRWLPWDGQALDLDAAGAIIDAIHAPRADPAIHDASGWAMMKSLGAIPINAPFLLAFIGLFAVVAGPVNLFWLAPAARRHRLFWTTPLISCAASLLLVVVILLQDGFGGQGERLMVTRLFPGEKQAVVVQEQAARTGVLLSRQFRLPENVLLLPLGSPSAASRSFEQAGRDYAGDWFMSRLVQAQRAEAIVPSRAEVQLLNPAEAEGGAAPVVVSSIPATLKEIGYLDLAGRRWHGSNLHTGEHMTLQPQTRLTLDPVGTGSAYLLGLQQTARTQPGSFFAVADDGPFIETLPSIRWRKQQAVYLGPVTPVR